jgi:tungstate transport system ATP-binding protein
MLDRLGLAHAARRNARTLSGGEQQRLALGRAWLSQPRVLLLDEPTANMDREFRRQTWALLQEVLTAELAIMVSSHELSARECPNCLNLHLQDGRLGAAPPSLHLVGQQQARPQEVIGGTS